MTLLFAVYVIGWTLAVVWAIRESKSDYIPPYL